MIEARLLSLWDGFLGSAALIAMIILALCVMVGAVKREDALRGLGVIVGIVILLIMLPAIILSLWNTMTLGQRVGTLLLFALIGLLLSRARDSATVRHK